MKKKSIRLIPGVGPSNPKLIVIGEAPGETEAIQGKPFVGKSGKILDVFLKRLGLTRDEVYITNVVKIHPENNKTPTFNEIKSWTPSLKEELAKIQCDSVLLLGGTALKAIMQEDVNINAWRGKVFYNQNGIDKYFLSVYHPSYVLRKPSAAKTVLTDLSGMVEVLNSLE